MAESFKTILARYTQNQITNPRVTAQGFGRLAERGSIGAALSFGLLSAKADRADAQSARVKFALENERLELERRRVASGEVTANANASLARSRSALVDKEAEDFERERQSVRGLRDAQKDGILTENEVAEIKKGFIQKYGLQEYRAQIRLTEGQAASAEASAKLKGEQAIGVGIKNTLDERYGNGDRQLAQDNITSTIESRDEGTRGSRQKNDVFAEVGLPQALADLAATRAGTASVSAGTVGQNINNALGFATFNDKVEQSGIATDTVRTQLQYLAPTLGANLQGTLLGNQGKVLSNENQAVVNDNQQAVIDADLAATRAGTAGTVASTTGKVIANTVAGGVAGSTIRKTNTVNNVDADTYKKIVKQGIDKGAAELFSIGIKNNIGAATAPQVITATNATNAGIAETAVPLARQQVTRGGLEIAGLGIGNNGQVIANRTGQLGNLYAAGVLAPRIAAGAAGFNATARYAVPTAALSYAQLGDKVKLGKSQLTTEQETAPARRAETISTAEATAANAPALATARVQQAQGQGQSAQATGKVAQATIPDKITQTRNETAKSNVDVVTYSENVATKQEQAKANLEATKQNTVIGKFQALTSIKLKGLDAKLAVRRDSREVVKQKMDMVNTVFNAAIRKAASDDSQDAARFRIIGDRVAAINNIAELKRQGEALSKGITSAKDGPWYNVFGLFSDEKKAEALSNARDLIARKIELLEQLDKR